jgi:eukaryotic-like serine/threonine-protein kinase
MQLWTDYEGVTIDGAFLLQKLLLPEGRSAFFSTAGPNGEPTVVRLIECHFDEEEILARWRCVEALSHPNFLKFEHYGQTELDGRPVVYAVFEKVDANLAEVLDQGHLTVKDVAQLASSLVAALDVLHTHGFIHEHIEPRNIFAVNDAVKLRSDCIREAREGEEGRAAKQRDVRDLATVLLQALTQRRSVEGIPDFTIPPPFGQIIRNGLDGTWGLENIRAALVGLFGSKQPAAPKSMKAAPAAPAVPEREVPSTQKAPSAAANPSMRPEPQLSLPLVNEDRSAAFAHPTTRKDTWGREDAGGPDQSFQDRSFSVRSRWLGVVGIVALLLLLSTWALAHAWNAHRDKPAQAATVSQSAAQSAKQISTGPANKPVAANLPSVSLHASAGSRADWRVIPFTYNRRTDAEKKASSLAHDHPELQPAVFTPSGHAPYLVSVGGVMDRDAAYALARRSRSLGLPHDTYAQNYSH